MEEVNAKEKRYRIRKEKLRKRSMRQSVQEQWESLFHHSADGIAVLDLEGRVQRINPAFENMFGWSEEESVGKRGIMIPHQLKEEVERIFSSVRQGHVVSGIETIRRRRDGEIIEVSNTYSPIRDDHGRVVGISAICRNISDRKRTEELLRRSDKLSVIGQLAAAVAHEIRNPLTSIKGFIQLFRSSIDAKYVEIMLSELERIEFIISEFLSLAKPQVANFKPHNIMTVIQNTLAIVNTQALMNKIQIELTADNNLPTIICDEFKVKQVLINVLKNAMEAMPDGGQIEVHVSKRHEYLHIQVIDQGCGIPKSRLIN